MCQEFVISVDLNGGTKKHGSKLLKGFHNKGKLFFDGGIIVLGRFEFFSRKQWEFYFV